jgi:hypothetical protein
MRKIPAGENRAERGSELQQAIKEPIHPFRFCPRRDTERHQTEAGRPSHGGDVAEAAGESFSACIRWFVRFPEKMNALDQKVAGEQEIVSRTTRPIDGAVVADPQYEGRIRRNYGCLPETFRYALFVAQVEFHHRVGSRRSGSDQPCREVLISPNFV